MRVPTQSLSWLTLPALAACALTVSVARGAEIESPETDVAPTAVAVVNGEAITLRDLEKRLESLHGEVGPTQRSAANLDRLLFRLVNDVLIGQEARFLGLHEEPPVPEAMERNRRLLAFSILERDEIKEPSEPEDHEVHAVFEERYGRASFHVLTAAELEGAEGILDALRDGAEILALAREKSIDPYGETGGLLESVARKDLQLAIANTVFRMAPDEVAGPVQTDLGWSILVARSFEAPDPELYEEARPGLARLVRQRKETAARRDLLEKLHPVHAVAIDQDLVDSIQPVRRPDGRLTAESAGSELVVARIGEEITLSADEYAVALDRRWRTIPDEEAARAAGPIILKTLVDERLLLAEAYRRGYHELPAVRRALHGLETEMIVPKYLSSVLAAGIEVSEEEKRAYYDENKDNLRRPPRVQLGKITVATLEEAESVAGALRKGADLGWLAARHSTDGLREKGGVQGWSVAQPNGDALSSILLESEAGTTLDPRQEQDSWVVYRVLAREEQGVFSYEEVSGNMREAVFKRRFTEVLDHFIQTVRSRSEIELHEDVLGALRLSGEQEEVEEGSAHGGHGANGVPGD